MPRLPQIKGDRPVNALRKANWYVDRIHGSHVIMRNEDKPGTKIIVPIHGKSGPGLVPNQKHESFEFGALEFGICLGFRYSNLEFRCQQLYLVVIGILTKRAWLI